MTGIVKPEIRNVLQIGWTVATLYVIHEKLPVRVEIGTCRQTRSGGCAELPDADHYKVTLVGSVPLQTVSESSKLPFRIEGQINIAAMRSELGRGAAKKAMLRSIAQLSDAQVKNQTISRHTAVEIEYW